MRKKEEKTNVNVTAQEKPDKTTTKKATGQKPKPENKLKKQLPGKQRQRTTYIQKSSSWLQGHLQVKNALSWR